MAIVLAGLESKVLESVQEALLATSRPRLWDLIPVKAFVSNAAWYCVQI